LNLAFFPDSKQLLFVKVANDKPAVALWDVTTKQEAIAFGEGELAEAGALLPHTRLSADGAWAAIGGGTVKVWDMVARKHVVALPVEQSAVWSVGWDPKVELLAAGSANGDLVIWNLPRVKAKLAEIGLGW
jgi:WD40 repeat protein